MMFWIRNITFLIVLIALGYYLIANEEELFSSPAKEELTQEELLADKQEVDETFHDKKQTVAVPVKKQNAAAEGLSRFYANLRGTDEDDGPRIKNNVVYLPAPQGDLIEILEAKRLVTRPLRRNWKSAIENRPFRAGFTLNQKLTEYAKKSGLEVFWWLDKDFIIKDPFRINKDIVRTTYQIGTTVSGHFPEGVRSYFCYKHRSLVLTDKFFEYLDEECTLLESKMRY